MKAQYDIILYTYFFNSKQNKIMYVVKSEICIMRWIIVVTGKLWLFLHDRIVNPRRFILYIFCPNLNICSDHVLFLKLANNTYYKENLKKKKTSEATIACGLSVSKFMSQELPFPTGKLSPLFH